VSLEDRVRGVTQGFNERGLDAMVEIWHPDVRYEEAPDFPGAGVFHGRDAVRARFEEYLAFLGVTHSEIEEVREEGDRAAWTVRLSGRSPEGAPHAHVWGYAGRFEDGLLVECRAYYNAADALAAV
jgi:ketosteroid isomerase-like protein